MTTLTQADAEIRRVLGQHQTTMARIAADRAQGRGVTRLDLTRADDLGARMLYLIREREAMAGPDA